MVGFAAGASSSTTTSWSPSPASAASVLANFRLRSELLHRAAAQRALGHRLDTLDELTRIGEEASSFEELAHRTVSLVREALGAVGVCYLLIEPGHHFETHAVAGESGRLPAVAQGRARQGGPGRQPPPLRRRQRPGGFRRQLRSTSAFCRWPARRASGRSEPSRSAPARSWPAPCCASSSSRPPRCRSTSRPWIRWPGSRALPWPTTACASASCRPRSGTGRSSKSRPTPCSCPRWTAPSSTPTRPRSGCTASIAARCWAATSAS